MLAANNSPASLQPIHYLEEKPLKIVKKLKPVKRRKLTTKKGMKRKSISKTRKRKTIQENVELEHNIKLEYNLNEGDGVKNVENSVANDPLFTPQIEVKCELPEEKVEHDGQAKEEAEEDSDKDEDYYMEECEEEGDDDGDSDDDDEDFKNYTKKRLCSRTTGLVAKDEEMTTDDDNEDEPLIVLTEMSARRVYKKKQKTARLKTCQDSCKFKCVTKFDRQQRLDIFKYYWHLSQEDKVNFIRQHIRKSVIKRIRSTKLRNNCCYFLRNYKIGIPSEIKQPEENQTDSVDDKSTVLDDDLDLIKVCRKFFDGTLGISDREIKEAIKDYNIKPEKILRPQKQEIIEEVTKKVVKKSSTEAQQPQQYLDPETGDLTDVKPKKPTRRRKRGEPPPEKFPKPINCAIRCKFKCHQKFSEVERKQICDIFWSLDFKRRKDFILSRIETSDVKTPITPEFRKTNRPTRAYQTKFYLRAGPKSENIRVCKHFILNTLCINRWFIENAIEFADKTTGAYTGSDRRGLTGGFNKISDDRKQTVLDHIESYPFWIPNKKSKNKYLHYSLNIKKMFDAYKEKSLAENIDYVSLHYYYQVFHSHFQILFLANPHPKKGRGYYKTNPNISHYTGEEAGGCWIDNKGNKLDLRSINPALTLDANQNNLKPKNLSIVPNAFAAASAAHALNVIHHSTAMENQQLSLAMVRSDLSSTSYGNLTAESVNMFRML